MNITVTVTENAYRKLQKSAEIRGLTNVEQFLENWEDELELERRQQLLRRIDERREKNFRENGLMPDSVELIREDRETR